jgi:hypothetical protein
MLRDASHRLGRFEAEGERRWKDLTGEARREALQLLRRLEKTLEPRRRKGRVAVTRRKAISTGRADGGDMAAQI